MIRRIGLFTATLRQRNIFSFVGILGGIWKDINEFLIIDKSNCLFKMRNTYAVSWS